ncbi:MAG: hypothetical protein Ct9H90mP14_3340 [Methanobacteriota archaeon]|nr:MAG: hypothetical protein Ct9H90mP14_3340 [Euryarchaeota archaeon]
MAIVLNSALSLFYYLRIGLVMFFEAPENAKPLRKALHLRNTILVLTVLTVFFGIGSGADISRLVETAFLLFDSVDNCRIPTEFPVYRHRAWFHIGVSRPTPNGASGGACGHRVAGAA